MTPIDVLALVRSQVRAAAESGHESIPVKEMDSLLENLQRRFETDDEAVSQAHIEFLKAELQGRLATWEQNQVDRRESVRRVNESGRNAINAAMSINGAASAAVLALLGHHVAEKIAIPPELRTALLLYLGGVLGGAVAYGFTYFTQYAWANEYRLGKWLNRVTIAVGIGSLVVFSIAGFFLSRAF